MSADAPVRTAADAQRARVYFALWPDADTARELHAAAATLRAACGGRPMSVDTLHLTLAFVGDIPRVQIPQLLSLAGEVTCPDFTVSIDMAAYWARQHLAWGGPSQTPDALADLAAQLTQRLQTEGLPVDRREFKPHVTLVRRCERAVEERAIGPVTWKVERFVLVESLRDALGARYRTVGEWPLGRSAHQ